MVTLSCCQEQDNSFSWSILIPCSLERDGFNYREIRAKALNANILMKMVSNQDFAICTCLQK